jgi:ketosteroid isomerase-like protein
VDTSRFARAWADGWARAWRTHDVDLVASLYAPDATFRSQPFREVAIGADGARGYAAWAFADEDDADCWFSEPAVVCGDRAVVEYWAVSRARDGGTATIAGVALLRFSQEGLVIEQRDYWNTAEGSIEPFDGWTRGASP